MFCDGRRSRMDGLLSGACLLCAMTYICLSVVGALCSERNGCVMLAAIATASAVVVIVCECCLLLCFGW